MRYMTRKDIMDRLRLSRSATYRIVGTAGGKLVSARDVVAILNQSRRGTQPLLLEVPADIVTGEELAKEIGSVNARQVRNWTRRTLNVPPHFLLNSHCRRFQLSAVVAWLDAHSKIIKRG